MKLSAVPFLTVPTSVSQGTSGVRVFNNSSTAEAWWDNVTIGQTPAFWLNATPRTGSLATAGTQDLTVTFNPTTLLPGEYTGQLRIVTDAVPPEEVLVPVAMYVGTTPNTAPTVTPQTVSLDEDTDVIFSLQGSDPEDNGSGSRSPSYPSTASSTR